MLSCRILILVFLLHANPAVAFTYFGGEIDYWREKPTKEEPHEVKEQKKSKNSFDWNKHSDPKNDEFFREGEYLPPAPFMELARHPSDDNIKRWFDYIDKKNEVSQRLHQRMQEYLAKQGSPQQQDLNVLVSSPPRQSAPDYSRYRFRMYFHSDCRHCKRMMQSMAELQELGYFVEIVQIDENKEAVRSLPFPVRGADQGELESKNIRTWPVLFVGDLQKNVVYRINGYQSTGDILNSIRRA